MTQFQYLERVAKWVKTLQLESEGSRFKPYLALSWAFNNCYLVVPQPTLCHSQRDNLSNPVFSKIFSTITTKPHYQTPGDLRVKIVTMRWLTSALLAMEQPIAVLKKYHTKFLSQYIKQNVFLNSYLVNWWCHKL